MIKGLQRELVPFRSLSAVTFGRCSSGPAGDKAFLRISSCREESDRMWCVANHSPEHCLYQAKEKKEKPSTADNDNKRLAVIVAQKRGPLAALRPADSLTKAHNVAVIVVRLGKGGVPSPCLIGALLRQSKASVTRKWFELRWASRQSCPNSTATN